MPPTINIEDLVKNLFGRSGWKVLKVVLVVWLLGRIPILLGYVDSIDNPFLREAAKWGLDLLSMALGVWRLVLLQRDEPSVDAQAIIDRADLAHSTTVVMKVEEPKP